MLDDRIINAAVYVGEEIYSKPYPDTEGIRANFYYKCTDGTIIHRPNHNILNALRRLLYCQPVIAYYKINGIPRIKKQFNLITEAEKDKILFILLFYTSGRKNEANIGKIFKKNVFANLQAYFAARQSFAPFEDVNELKRYADLLLSSAQPREGKDEAIALLLKSCHMLELLRCFPQYKLQRALFDTFNQHSGEKNTRNLQSLVYYAQNCILATGDKLRTQYSVRDIQGAYYNQGFHLRLQPSRLKLIKTGNKSWVIGAKGYDEAKFKAATRVDEAGIRSTLLNLEQVPKPVLFENAVKENFYTAKQALELIEKGDAAVRIINGNPEAISLRFEFEQIRNPAFVRPVREKKLKIPHTFYYDSLAKETVSRPEKDYIELSQQVPIKSKQDLPIYSSYKSISKQEDRGKPKRTVFAKKSSFSLLPKNGIFSLFKGRLEYRIKSPFTSIGLLHNLEEMDTKGERYCWSKDVRSSGIGGYFWLSKKVKPTAASAVTNEQLSISELKEKLQNDSSLKFNELLLSSSLNSLKALFATKDNRMHRLTVLHASAVLSCDYGISRPLLIVTGESKPKVYSSNQIQTDLIQALKKYGKWYWRLFHVFASSEEQQLLLELIARVSCSGLKVNQDELIQYFTVSKSESCSTKLEQVRHRLPTIVEEDEESESNTFVQTKVSSEILASISEVAANATTFVSQSEGSYASSYPQAGFFSFSSQPQPSCSEICEAAKKTSPSQ